MDVTPNDSDADLVEVARFARLAEARESALVLVAKGIPYVVVRFGDVWSLQVDRENDDVAARELGIYKSELTQTKEAPDLDPRAARTKVRFWSLAVVAWLILLLSVVQAERGPDWETRGILASDLVLKHGQWWRILTALTLHGDVPHVLANLAGGLLFAGLLILRFGQGVAWLLILVSGGVGNWLNCLIYINQAHRSLGASTGVFGALGLLSGDALVEVLMHKSGISWWRWVVPIGAGIALLSFLGSGGQSARNVDVLAHFWGFFAGLILGVVVGRFRPVDSVSKSGQVVCGGAALVILAMAWFFALNFAKAA